MIELKTSKVVKNIIASIVIIIAVIFTISFIYAMGMKSILKSKANIIHQAVLDKIQFTVPGAKIIGSIPDGGIFTYNFTYNYSSNRFIKSTEYDKIKVNYLPIINHSDIKYYVSGDSAKNKRIIESKFMSQNISTEVGNYGNNIKIQGVLWFKEPLSIEDTQKFSDENGIEFINSWHIINLDNKVKNTWGFSLPVLIENENAIAVSNENKKVQTEGVNYDLNAEENEFKKEMKNFELSSKYLKDISLSTEIEYINNYLYNNKTTIKGIVFVADKQSTIKLVSAPKVQGISILETKAD